MIYAERTDFHEYAIHVDRRNLELIEFALELVPESAGNEAKKLSLNLKKEINIAKAEKDFSKRKQIILCDKCAGAGKIRVMNREYEYEKEICTRCNGEGSIINITTEYRQRLTPGLKEEFAPIT